MMINVLTQEEFCYALRDIKGKIREIDACVVKGERIPLYGLLEELQFLAHEARELVANGGKWNDFHTGKDE